jgi:hypothetical protein
MQTQTSAHEYIRTHEHTQTHKLAYIHDTCIHDTHNQSTLFNNQSHRATPLSQMDEGLVLNTAAVRT